MRKFTLFAILSVLAALFIACDDSSSGASNADEQAEAISSESTTDEGTSSAEDAILYSSNADDEGTSSNTEDAFGESSSSKVIQDNLSSEVNENFSSEVQSSSSETQSSSSEAVLYIYDRTGIKYAIYKFSGDTSEVQKAGRFEIIHKTSLNKNTKEKLKDLNVVILSSYNSYYPIYSQYPETSFFKSTKDIKKYVLDSLIEGFFNSITVDDTNKIEIEFDPRDWQENVRVCDEEKNCHYETIEKDSIYMFIYYWEDISGDKCTEIVEDCGAVPVEECWDNYGIGIMAPKSSIECLESSRDIMYIQPAHYEEVLD